MTCPGEVACGGEGVQPRVSGYHVEEVEKHNCLSHVRRALLTRGQHFVTGAFIVPQGKNSKNFWGGILRKYREKRLGDMYKRSFWARSLPVTSRALFALGHRTCALFPENINSP